MAKSIVRVLGNNAVRLSRRHVKDHLKAKLCRLNSTCQPWTRSSYRPRLSELHVADCALTDSFHVHVRQGAMCELVTPHVAQGGIRTAYVMVRAVLGCAPLHRSANLTRR